MKVLIPMHTAKGLALFHAQVSFRKISNEMNTISKANIKAEKLRNIEMTVLSISNLLTKLPKANFCYHFKIFSC